MPLYVEWNTLTGPIIPKPFADLSLNENAQVSAPLPLRKRMSSAWKTPHKAAAHNEAGAGEILFKPKREIGNLSQYGVKNGRYPAKSSSVLQPRIMSFLQGRPKS